MRSQRCFKRCQEVSEALQPVSRAFQEDSGDFTGISGGAFQEILRGASWGLVVFQEISGSFRGSQGPQYLV